MKALTFLQYAGLTDYSVTNSYDKLAKTGEYYHLVLEPFTPELITKYFEGWRKGISSSGFYCINGHNEIIFHSMTPNSMAVCLEGFAPEDFIKPETLDDFIRDCQRAGIELEWRQK